MILQDDIVGCLYAYGIVLLSYSVDTVPTSSGMATKSLVSVPGNGTRYSTRYRVPGLGTGSLLYLQKCVNSFT